jgi:HlyD family secretion protein
VVTATKRRWYATALVLVVFLVAWSARELHQLPTVQVVTASVSRGPIVRRVVATGTLQAVTTVQIGAQVSGTVQSLNADYNSIVHAGQEIATLDPGLFDAALGEARAALARAQAAEAQAEADEKGLEAAAGDARTKLTRAQALAAGDLIPLADLDAARTAMGEADTDLESGESKIGEARAAVREARAAVGQATIDLDRTVIRSPIDGIVVSRNVDVGQTVAASVQAPVLFTIAADVKRMQLNVEVDESEVGGIQEGECATFEVEAYPKETFEGVVSQIRLQPVVEASTSPPATGGSAAGGASTTSSAVVSYATIIDVSNADERLRPGMTATVALTGAQHDSAVRIPNNALAFRPSLDVLTAVGQPEDVVPSGSESLTDPTRRRVWRFDGRVFTPIEVRVGLGDGQWTELVSGPLGPGDALVTGASIQR